MFIFDVKIEIIQLSNFIQLFNFPSKLSHEYLISLNLFYHRIDISSNFFYRKKYGTYSFILFMLCKICNKTHIKKYVYTWKSPVFNNLFFYPIYLQHDFDVHSTFSEIITMLLESSRSKMWFRTNVVNPLCLLRLNSTNFVCISFELDSGQLLPRISIGSGIAVYGIRKNTSFNRGES